MLADLMPNLLKPGIKAREAGFAFFMDYRNLFDFRQEFIMGHLE
jgi:hypothetical protein